MRAALDRAVADGIAGAALLDRDGRIIALAGELPDDEARPITEFVMMRADDRTRDRKLTARLFAGEILFDHVAGRDIAVGIAGRQLFVIAVLGGAKRELAESLRSEVERMLDRVEPPFVPTSGSGGSGGSGPDSLALIELGITVPRAKA